VIRDLARLTDQAHRPGSPTRLTDQALLDAVGAALEVEPSATAAARDLRRERRERRGVRAASLVDHEQSAR